MTEAELKKLTKTDLTCPCGGEVEVRLAKQKDQIVACCVCTKCRRYSQNTVPHVELKNAITEAKEKWKRQSKSK